MPQLDPLFANACLTDLQRTETFDDMPMNASDPRFDVFYEFEAYLRETFPLFHEQLSFERINVHGLMFTWNGSNPDLKPIVSIHPPLSSLLE